MFGFFRRQVLLPPSSWTSFRGREGEEGCFVVVLFRYEANSFWYAALLSVSLSLFRKRGMGYTVLGSVSKKGFFRGKVLKVIHESRR